MYWNNWIQISQTGDQLYSDTFPFGEFYLASAYQKMFKLNRLGEK